MIALISQQAVPEVPGWLETDGKMSVNALNNLIRGALQWRECHFSEAADSR